ncbi:hypothetical protein GCM10009682_24930 [Luedemannella flava]|uniref:Uncharacterized protein n=1 Tax=Luedemannella flava TaxID=349316 RepID=A0ABN2LXA0_9ACTN
MVSEREWWAWQDGRRDDTDWDELATALPPEVAALLNAMDAGGGDEDESWPAPDDPCAFGPAMVGTAAEPARQPSASATYAACTPRFLAPAPLRSRSQRVRQHASRVR